MKLRLLLSSITNLANSKTKFINFGVLQTKAGPFKIYNETICEVQSGYYIKKRKKKSQHNKNCRTIKIEVFCITKNLYEDCR